MTANATRVVGEEKKKTRTKKKRQVIDRVIGIDLGNGLVKVRSKTTEGTPYLLTLHSGFGYLKQLGRDSYINTKLDLDTFRIDDVDYVWGADVDELESVKSTYGHANRYRSEAFKIMAKIVMAKVVYDLEIAPDENILIITGVPSNQTHTRSEDDIIQAFKGDEDGSHEVYVNEEQYTFNVAEVMSLSQPVATVLGRYLNDDGYVEDREYETMKVAVINIGAGTTDLDIVKNLKRMPLFHSVPRGFRDVYDKIREEAIRPVFPSHEVGDYKLYKCLDTLEYKASKREEIVDLSDAFERGVHEVIVDVQEAIMSKWKDQTDFDQIILTGGSIEAFQNQMARIASGIEVPENHGTSDVEGYHSYGVHVAREMNE